MEEKKKKKHCNRVPEYYTAFAEKLVNKGCVCENDLVEILLDLDRTFGYTEEVNPKWAKYLFNYLRRKAGKGMEVETAMDRKPGGKTIYSISIKNLDEVRKAIEMTTTTPRQAPITQQKAEIKPVEKTKPVDTTDDTTLASDANVVDLWKTLILLADALPVGLSREDLRKKGIVNVRPVPLARFLGIGTAIKGQYHYYFNKKLDVVKVLRTVAEYSKSHFNRTLTIPDRFLKNKVAAAKSTESTASASIEVAKIGKPKPAFGKIGFAIAAILNMFETRSYVDIGTILRSNTYYRTDMTTLQIQEFVRSYPDVFTEVFGRTHVRLNSFNKALEYYDPTSVIMRETWYIQSPCSLEEIKKIFPAAEYDSALTKNIIVIPRRDSFRDFVKLAWFYLTKLNGKTDYCIGNPELMKQLQEEEKNLFERVRKQLLSRQAVARLSDLRTREDDISNDSIFYTVEEMIDLS